MKNSPHNLQKSTRRTRGLRAIVAVAVMVLLAAACGGSDDAANTAAADPIETNDGNVSVRPPDVLEGNPEPTPEPVVEATSVPSAPEADAVAFEYEDGSPGTTADFVGQPTVLNFWASNCPACIREMPEFEEVSQALLGQVDFIGMNVNDTSRQDADRLADQTGVTYPLAFDTNSQVFSSVGAFVMPTTVFLDQDGAVAFVWSGVLTGSELTNLIAEHIAPGVATDV